MSNTQDVEAKQHLLIVLRERGISFSEDDIDWAFDSPKTRDEMTAWVKEYLSDETLISANELQLFQDISAQKRGMKVRDGILPLTDGQLDTAIRSLQDSTTLIEQHTKELEKQWESLQTMRDHALQRQHNQHKQPASSQQIDYEVEAVNHLVEEEFGQVCKEAETATLGIKNLVSEKLEADDAVLQALAKLAPKTMPAAEDSLSIEQVVEWTNLLALLREQAAIARIDDIFNNAMCELADREYINDAGEASQDDLTAELTILKGEIVSVMELVVGAEFRQPLTKMIKKDQVQSRTSQHEWLHYTLATMEHMINQLDAIALSVADIESYNHTLAEIQNVLVSINNRHLSKQPSLTKDAASGQVGQNQKPDLRAGIANSQLAEQVFRRFSVSGRSTRDVLAKATSMSSVRLQQQYVSITCSTAETLAKFLDEQRQQLQVIMKQVFAYSDYATVRLGPKELEESVQSLDVAIAQTASTLSDAESGDLEAVRLGIARLQTRTQAGVTA